MDYSVLFFVVSIQTFLVSTNASPSPLPDHLRLVSDLLRRQEDRLGSAATYTKPLNRSGPIDIRITLKYRRLIGIDTFAQTLTSKVWLYMEWYDEFLKWNPHDYGNITYTVWHAISKIWFPDLTFYDAVELKLTVDEHGNGGMLYNTGRIAYSPTYLVAIPCMGDVISFPFDEHFCKLSIGSWLYPVQEMNITRIPDQHSFFEFFSPNPHWTLTLEDVFTSVLTDDSFYPLEYQTLDYMIKVKRNASFSFISLILPGCLLNILLVVLFLLPPDFEDRLTIGVSIFLSYVVLLIVLVEAIPPGGESLPLMGRFYCINMCMAVSCILGCTLVYNLQKRSTQVSATHKRIVHALAAILLLSVDDTNHGNSDGEGNKFRGHWLLLARVMDRIFLIAYIVITSSACVVTFMFWM